MDWSPINAHQQSHVVGIILVLLVQPSSAAAERVFLTFSAKQESALEDYVQLSVMQYNYSS